MGALKTYNAQDVNLNQLSAEIAAAGCVQDFKGVTNGKGSDVYVVHGTALTDESALDAIVAGHTAVDLQPLSREIGQKRRRKDYGVLLHDLVASQLRLDRISNDPSLAAHAAERAASYVHFVTLQKNIDAGNFISAYEDVNGLTVEMGLTIQQITTYRMIVATYLTSTGNYTDVFGNKVRGGQYDELKGKPLDVNYFIIES